jgi:hypothetical protein
LDIVGQDFHVRFAIALQTATVADGSSIGAVIGGLCGRAAVITCSRLCFYHSVAFRKPWR